MKGPTGPSLWSPEASVKDRKECTNATSVMRGSWQKGQEETRELRLKILDLIRRQSKEVFESQGYGKWPGTSDWVLRMGQSKNGS